MRIPAAPILAQLPGCRMSRLSFGEFELDPTTGELWKGKGCVHMQEQPLKLLLCLLERPGQLVGREELQKRVWPGDIHVGFEDGLNAAAWRLRQVLGDSADRPIFIETVPRKGYRFVGRVVPLPGKAPPPSGSFPMPVFRSSSAINLDQVVQAERPRVVRRTGPAAVLGLGLLAAGALVWVGLRPGPSPLLVTPLANATNDPAVDYFAAALSRQVVQDLGAAHGMSVRAVEAGARTADEGALTLTWSLAREVQGYRITVNLADARGEWRGGRVFLVSPEDLHQAHRAIAAYVAGISNPRGTPAAPADPAKSAR